MTTVVVLGTQWGDEGKGKFVDVIAKKADLVVRFQGGNNAGHTIKIGDEKFILQLLPSGVLYDTAQCIIGSGVVVDLKVLLKELSVLEEKGRSTNHVFISDKAHIIMPYHIKLDELSEQYSKNKIGTTKRGIGFCYSDKMKRTGIRACDLLDFDIFKEKLKINVIENNKILKHIYNVDEMSYTEIEKEFKDLIDKVKHRIINSETLIRQAAKDNKYIIFEGAQASMLDIDFGTYPYVTSSSPSVGGLLIGTGIPYTYINNVVGIVKAYSTRVGEGPFVTEQLNEVGETLRTKGQEYGSVTSRDRRCGFLDLIVVKSSVEQNGIKNIVLTKLDILSFLQEIKICIGYKLDGETIDYIPTSIENIKKLEPIYKTFDSWDTDISEIKDFELLPEQCKKYVNYISDFLKCNVTMISVGPKREQNIYIDNSLL